MHVLLFAATSFQVNNNLQACSKGSFEPYGRGKLFNELIDKADFEKLAKLLKIMGLLLQTKDYLFWKRR